MAAPNYSFAKKQRELAKKQKKAEKQARKTAKNESPEEAASNAEGGGTPTAPDSKPVV